jgi:hypothetical protein
MQSKEAAIRKVVELSDEFLKENDPDLKRAAAILLTLAGTLSGPKRGMEDLLEIIAEFNEKHIAAIRGR